MPTTECLAILQDAIVILLCPPCRISGNNCTDNTQFFTESLYVSIFKRYACEPVCSCSNKNTGLLLLGLEQTLPHWALYLTKAKINWKHSPVSYTKKP